MPQPKVSAKIGSSPSYALRTPWDLRGYSVTSELRDNHGQGNLIASLNPTLVTNPETGLLGQINLSLGTVATEGLSPSERYAFDVKMIAPNGKVVYCPTVILDFQARVTRG